MRSLVAMKAAFFTAMFLKLAMAVDHTVGGSSGWDLTTDFATWSSSQQFAVGDNLVFQYSSTHNVLEVSESDYDSCQNSNPLLTDASGMTTVPLTKSGKRYFICGVSSHCDQGMKLEVNVLASAASPPSSSPPAATNGTTTAPSPSSPAADGEATAPSSSPAAVDGEATTPSSSPAAADTPSSMSPEVPDVPSSTPPNAQSPTTNSGNKLSGGVQSLVATALLIMGFIKLFAF